MKWYGALVLAIYALLMLSGWTPFSDGRRDQATGNVRRGPGGVLIWTGGYHGGK